MSDIVVQEGRASSAETSLVERLALSGLRRSSQLLQPVYFKGYGRIASVLRRVAPERHIALQLDADSRFRFPFADAYWSRLLARSVVYEPEMVTLFQVIRDQDFGFVDCGANFGYWSVLVSGQAFGAHAAIAIEASGRNAAELRANAAINQNRFEVVHAAVAETDGGMVTLDGPTHEGLAIVDATQTGPDAETVCCVSLDGLMTRSPWFAQRRRLVLKLDVEGVEEAALRGAGEMLKRETLLVYEEQGADAEHRNTRFVSGALGMPVFVYDGSRFREAPDPLAAMRGLKTNRRRGYNVLATASPEWLALLRRA
ncbi:MULTISPECIES: FkbM family methyltransferase [unclassified Bosea (in: a-proteobacteria)]|uniref:FkbM family methyltransferase n=1 Tax=unclassified Bosea (in: a-proteobacteria) TaxID=2653178 RepID=UPI0012F12C94|nr:MULTISPECIES: FkbM family methyltransferase [unclassified Bosea (in: a-proteobacteria)]CAD5277503.1 Methyltransferase FkbM family protein [Bosea sp. 7B]VXC02720.1 Methyltransferase FkbM family protein [Bosea sp. 125]VXC79399.1 Methyltransferase FkbM family protein [Bosea sp. 127]